VIVGMATELTQQEAATGGEMNNKFASDPDSYSMSYGTQCEFFAGLEDLIGSPDPRVERAMMREHCNAEDSNIEWTTENYKVTTTPEIEWHFVRGNGEDPKIARRARSMLASSALGSGKEAPPSPRLGQEDARSGWKWPEETVNTQHRRQWKDISDFKDVFDGINAKLKEKGEQPLELVEWIGGRLYTGPMFEKYNAVNRGGAVKTGRQSEHMVKKFNDLCRGNRYCTTIHAINSALIKLSKLEKADKLYRGTQRGVLPDCFWHEDESGVRGGIEYGFLSCSRDLEVAKQYVQHGSALAATIFEIQTGMIDRGADLSPLSQYPHEREICFPPLTGMEVLGSRIEGSILYIQIRLNVNFSALTIDQVINKRKRLVTDMCKNLRSEVSTAVERYQWAATAGQYSKSEAAATSGAVRDLACRKLTSLAEDEAAEHFNNDVELLSSIRMALEITDSVKWMTSSVLREAVQHLKHADLESAAACAERHAAASSNVEFKELAPITLKRGDMKGLGLTQGSDRLHILDKLKLREVAGVIRVQEPHELFKLGSVQEGCILYKVNAETDVAQLPRELISEGGAELTFLRPLSPEELKESLLAILRQAKTDAASIDRLVLETARALALNPLRNSLFIREAGLDAGAGKILARALESNNTIKDAVLSKNSLGGASKAMQKMLLQNRTLKSLRIDGNGLGSAGGLHMAEALEGNDTLHSLRIGWNGIGEVGGAAVAEALSKNMRLKALNTEFNDLGRRGGEAFGNALRCSAHLLALHIDGNKLGPDGGESIAIALETNVTLQHLWIPENELGERGGRAFAKALRSNRTLEHLGIAKNGIGSDAGAEIADAVKGNPCLKTLRIGSNELGSRGGLAFAEALRVNSSLSTLELSSNSLQAEATIAIAGSLRQSNRTLARLDMVKNGIGVEGLRALADALEENATLKVLKVHGNSIGPCEGEFLGRALGKNGGITTIKLDGVELSGEAIGEMLRSNSKLEVLAFAGSVSAEVIGIIGGALAESASSQLQAIHLASDDGVKQDVANMQRMLKQGGKSIAVKIEAD